MFNTILKLTMGFSIVALAAHQAAAQTRNCAPHPVVLERLTGHFGETRQSIGVAANNAVVEVFAAAETGTWSITVTMPNGMTCLVASGQSFETLAEALPPKGDDA